MRKARQAPTKLQLAFRNFANASKYAVLNLGYVVAVSAHLLNVDQ
jgi:hypothetical protein